jgi:hypothetical protein
MWLGALRREPSQGTEPLGLQSTDQIGAVIGSDCPSDFEPSPIWLEKSMR